MNGRVKCVENPGRNSECMHVKCKFVVIVVWNNFVGIKFTSTIWQPYWGIFFFCFCYNNKHVFLQFLLLYYR
jgi:hypothetical protein